MGNRVITRSMYSEQTQRTHLQRHTLRRELLTANDKIRNSYKPCATTSSWWHLWITMMCQSVNKVTCVQRNIWRQRTIFRERGGNNKSNAHGHKTQANESQVLLLSSSQYTCTDYRRSQTTEAKWIHVSYDQRVPKGRHASRHHSRRDKCEVLWYHSMQIRTRLI